MWHDNLCTGCPAINPQACKHLTPAEFHTAVSDPDPDLVLLDCRNHYESQIGSFEGTLTV